VRYLALFPALLLAQADLFEPGNELLQKGQLAGAEQAYRTHLKTHPGHVEALENLGAVLSRREEFGEAVLQYRKALQLRQTFARLQHFAARSGRNSLILHAGLVLIARM